MLKEHLKGLEVNLFLNGVHEVVICFILVLKVLNIFSSDYCQSVQIIVKTPIKANLFCLMVVDSIDKPLLRKQKYIFVLAFNFWCV